MGDDLPLLGFGLPVAGPWARPEVMLHVARRAEALGYASLWTFQRLLSPADAHRDRDAEAARNPGTRPPDDPAYRAVHDPLLPLAFVGGHTERIGLGTATVCAPLLAPAVLAKAMTTLDHLTSGRLTVGLGLGWLPQEYAAAGVPFARRGARLEEYLRCLHALWTQDPVEHTGEFYSISLSHNGLRPVQKPHPPVLLGGAAPAALRRAGRIAEGWIASSRHDVTRLAESVEVVRAGAREAGRDPDDARIVVRAAVDLTDDDPGPGRRPFHGTAEQLRHDLARARGQGATEVLVDLNLSTRPVSADVGAATAEADRVLTALAPGEG